VIGVVGAVVLLFLIIGGLVAVLIVIESRREREKRTAVYEPPPPRADFHLSEQDVLDLAAAKGSGRVRPVRFLSRDIQGKVACSLNFNYLDARGEFSNRTVEVERVERGRDGPTVVGFCHLRQGVRNFSIYRISECHDTETGEVIDDLAGFLSERIDLQRIIGRPKPTTRRTPRRRTPR
jgi:predicted DNA-binding transcriptional regulator YafY